ncbi:MAG TPA: Gfo/Idh/MocA family oxidoreductase [Flavitalea sp.]|nr:Gfo/Idh/MocA family oxidoreductase [Flavitalea sp.]
MEKRKSSRKEFVVNGALAIGGLMFSGLPVFSWGRLKNDSIGIGIIGCGARGRGLAGILKTMKGVTLTAFCDILPENLQKAMELAPKGVKSFTDYRKLLEDKRVDAVVIATPLFLHAPMSIAALQAGKHVYEEKSLAYDIPQSMDLLRTVRNTDLVFQVGYQYRYDPKYKRVKEIIEQGWLGKITHIECQFNRNSDWRNPVKDPSMERVVNWRLYKEYCGGPLSELCAHQIDAIHFMFGGMNPVKVAGMGGVNYWKDGRDTYDNIRAIYEYPNDIKASIVSVLSNAYNGYFIRILGDKATVEIQRKQAFIYAESLNNKQGTVDGVTGATLLNKTQGEAVELTSDEIKTKTREPSFYSLEDFIDCIRNRRGTISNAETAYQSSIAIHLGNMSAEEETFKYWNSSYNI